MLQRSSLPTTSPAEIADSLQRTFDGPFSGPFSGRRWQALQDVLPMPVTWQQYMLACLALTIVVGGMWLQVLLSVQIARSEFTLRQMRGEYARVERQNSDLVFAISQQSSLAHMAELATQSGYVPATGRTYIVRDQQASTLPQPLHWPQRRLNRSHSTLSLPLTAAWSRRLAGWIRHACGGKTCSSP